MHVHPPPPQPERLVMRKDEAVGNMKKIIKIFKKSIKFFSVQKNRQITGGRSAQKVHPPGKILGTPLIQGTIVLFQRSRESDLDLHGDLL